MKFEEVKPGKTYKIKGKIKYFEEKYGKGVKKIIIEDQSSKVFGQPWFVQNVGNPTVYQFTMRNMEADMKEAFYGKVNNLGELVYPEEIEEL